MAALSEESKMESSPEKTEAPVEAGPGAEDTTSAPPNVPNDGADVAAAETTQTSSEHASDDSPHDVEKSAGPPGAEHEPERSRAKIALIMLALCLAVFLAAIDITIITTALPTISGYFHSSAGYTWIGSAYLLGAAASTPIWGKLSDIWGRKPILLIANAVFFVGSLIAALSTSIGMLITARAIQGTGGGGLIVLVNICIGDLFSQRRRGAYYGVIGGVWAVASSLGPILGGAFTQNVTWRWCFYINLPLDGLAFVILLVFLDIKTPTTPFVAGIKAIDWVGALLVVGGTLMFLFGIQYGGETFPWDSATVVCLIVFGVFTACLFVVYEWKMAKYPIMPTRIFNNRSTLASLGVCFMHGFVFIGGSYYMPLYFQAVLGATPILSGVYILAQSISLSISSISTGIFIRKTGQFMPPIIAGFALMTIGYALYTNLDANSSWAKIILYQVVAGLGVGPNFQAPLIALQSHISPRDIATATSTFGFTRNIGTSISVVIGQVVFQNQMSKQTGKLTAALGPALAKLLGGGNAGANIGIIHSLPPAQKRVAVDAFASSLRTMWIVYVCFSGVGLVMVFLIKRKNLQKTHEETKTGLVAEENNRVLAAQEKKEREEAKAKRRANKSNGADVGATEKETSGA